MNETLSKQEYQYLKNIEKLEQLVEKLEAKGKEQTRTERQLTARVDELENEINEHSEEHEKQDNLIHGLKRSNSNYIDRDRSLNAQLAESVKEATKLRDILYEKNKKIELLENKALSEKELLFYYACKADLVLSEFVKQKKLNILPEELKSKGFSPLLIEQIMKEPMVTSNYTLTFSNKSFQIKTK